jgi:hypothetical protein
MGQIAEKDEAMGEAHCCLGKSLDGYGVMGVAFVCHICVSHLCVAFLCVTFVCPLFLSHELGLC